MRKELLPDYRIAHFTTREKWLAFPLSLLPGVMIVFLFYRKLWALPVVPLFSWPSLRLLLRYKQRSRAKKLHRDFRQALQALSVSLDAGRSVENAFPAVTEHLSAVCGKDADLTGEFSYMEKQLRHTRPAKLLSSLAMRTEDPDIRRFSTVFSIAEARGGSLSQIVRDAAREIGEKMEIEAEIEAAVAAKKYEQKFMCAILPLLILYMQLASPGFLDLLYETLLGHVVMTIALAVYLLAIWWGARITEMRI